MNSVLVVDDDPGVLDVVAFTLRREGFDVDEETDGARALEAARTREYDLVILDVMLPQLSGTDVCRALRAESDVPIVMLTARDAERDRVLGLDVGADDYVTKPFSSAELVSRVRAILRRRELDRPAIRRLGGLHLDLVRHEVTVDGDPRTADALRVQGALAPGRAAGAGHLPAGDHAAPVGERPRRGRARVRGARLEPPPEDRARPGAAAAARDRARARVQAPSRLKARGLRP